MFTDYQSSSHDIQHFSNFENWRNFVVGFDANGIITKLYSLDYGVFKAKCRASPIS